MYSVVHEVPRQLLQAVSAGGPFWQKGSQSLPQVAPQAQLYSAVTISSEPVQNSPSVTPVRKAAQLMQVVPVLDELLLDELLLEELLLDEPLLVEVLVVLGLKGLSEGPEIPSPGSDWPGPGPETKPSSVPPEQAKNTTSGAATHVRWWCLMMLLEIIACPDVLCE